MTYAPIKTEKGQGRFRQRPNSVVTNAVRVAAGRPLVFLMGAVLMFGAGRASFAGCTCGCLQPGCNQYICSITCGQEPCGGANCPGGVCLCRCPWSGAINCNCGGYGCACSQMCPNGSTPCGGARPCWQYAPGCVAGGCFQCVVVCPTSAGNPCGGGVNCLKQKCMSPGCDCGTVCPVGNPPCYPSPVACASPKYGGCKVGSCTCGNYCFWFLPCGLPTYCTSCFSGQTAACSHCPGYCGRTGKSLCGGSANCTLVCSGCWRSGPPETELCSNQGTRTCYGSTCCAKGCSHGQWHRGPCNWYYCSCGTTCTC